MAPEAGTNGIFFFEDFMMALLFVFFDKFVEGGRTPEFLSELTMLSKALTAGSWTRVVVHGIESSKPLTIWQAV